MQASPQVVRFGGFEVDLKSGGLRKNGRKLKLRGQPFQILTTLLERPGEVVTREKLQQKLWPDGTFVDFDHSLNTAVNKIREVLGDSAENPRFIETLPRRGYRFIAPLEGSRLDADLRAATTTAGPSESSGKERSGKEESRVNGWIGVAIALVLTAGIAVWLNFSPGHKAPVSPPRIVPFTSFPGYEVHPTFSSDGNQLAYSWSKEKGDNFDIYVQLIGTGGSLKLTHHPDADFSPVWSPDSRSIAFVRQSETGRGVFLVSALGGHERKLAEVATTISRFPCLAWSADGESLVIVDKSAPKEPYGLFLFSIDTGERKRLTFPPAGSPGDGGPVVSPDGKRLAFFRFNKFDSAEVYVVPSAGGEPKRLTFDDRQIHGLTWTADSTQIIFSTDPHGGDVFSLWRVRADGGRPEPLIGFGENLRFPSVSRQGSRLAYTPSVSDANIWRVDGVGSDHKSTQPAKLMASTRHDTAPQYSPDGKRIAFVSDRSGKYEFWICDSEGHNPYQLLSDGKTGAYSWSPDGQRIAFDSSNTGRADIYVMSAEGGVPRQLTKGSSNGVVNVVPRWSRDGPWIYFGSNRGGDWQVWKISSRGGQAVQVTTKGGHVALESPDGKSLYYSKAGLGIPGLWKMPVEGGEEIRVIESLEARLWGYWDVVDRGIYFVETPSDKLASAPGALLKFMSFATGRIREITPLEKPPCYWNPGLSASPDGRWVLYQDWEEQGGDIMLAENFH
jgi:Tol biopolymer transport system component/DNA-binding winged helix-turn-helix (wHTH) protein